MSDKWGETSSQHQDIGEGSKYVGILKIILLFYSMV